jgi:hypothetical protein
MINRYEEIQIKNNETGKRVTRSVIYPPIPRSLNDIYLLTTPGDRLDLLAKTYYGDVGYWWILAEANAIGKGDLVLPVGIQLRVPKEVSKILADYKTLNT